jgi:hypothetical protein
MAAFDFNGLSQINTQYLADLSGMAQNPDGTLNVTINDQANSLANLQKKLNGLNTQFTTANASAGPLLDHQQEMNRILNLEQHRLQMKKTNIDGAFDGKKRMIYLNESYRKRHAAYTKITITIVVALLLYVGIYWFNQMFPVLPSGVVDVLTILIFSIAIIYIAITYNRILMRDRMNFDELELPPPADQGNANVGGAHVNYSGNGFFDGVSLLCMNGACCADGTTWSNGKCIPTPAASTSATTTKSAFTTIAQAYSELVNQPQMNINAIVKIKPYGPSEFDGYGKV